ncbi:hypothetical protein E1A91_D12G065200v1 [Gossypium mustelinum]|uniref:Uncharacterized protein n=1 Tax=Gossypium mustelinum TaxID=34275 RepID=A0A5D2SAI8_GOSMU|nr:hypothetical protein E1A91_D12G065200v1 [Gossypium mustelinum]
MSTGLIFFPFFASLVTISVPSRNPSLQATTQWMTHCSCGDLAFCYSDSLIFPVFWVGLLGFCSMGQLLCGVHFLFVLVSSVFPNGKIT